MKPDTHLVYLVHAGHPCSIPLLHHVGTSLRRENSQAFFKRSQFFSHALTEGTEDLILSCNHARQLSSCFSFSARNWKECSLPLSQKEGARSISELWCWSTELTMSCARWTLFEIKFALLHGDCHCHQDLLPRCKSVWREHLTHGWEHAEHCKWLWGLLISYSSRLWSLHPCPLHPQPTDYLMWSLNNVDQLKKCKSIENGLLRCSCYFHLRSCWSCHTLCNSTWRWSRQLGKG